MANDITIDTTTARRILRMAYGYELMHRALCFMAGTSGDTGRAYMVRAQEAQARVSPVFGIGPESNSPRPGDCFVEFERAFPEIAVAARKTEGVASETPTGNSGTDIEMDWLRGDWFEAYQDCMTAIDEGGVEDADLERLRGRVENTIRAALAAAPVEA